MTPGETGFSSYWCVHSAGAEENQGFRNKYKEKIFIMIAFFEMGGIYVARRCSGM